MRRLFGLLVCLGPLVLSCSDGSAPPTGATGIGGTFRGSYNMTRTSDLPPREGDVTERSPWEIVVTPVGSAAGLFTMMVDPNCPLRADGSGADATTARVFAGALCRPLILLPGTTLSTRSGTLDLVGGRLTVRVEFQYQSTDGSDHGTLAWSYTGVRQ
ncbi:MAG: hypothetical protein JWM10_4075 [Myxococcaceae bacterium]|nr:hypothetical protein [Myxococcaceae bacterium]